MKSFIKENLLIVAGIALPLLVVIFFAVANVLPNLYTPAPAHDLLLVRHQYHAIAGSPVKIVLTVQEGKLTASVAEASNSIERRMVLGLFRYSHATGVVQEVDIPLPDDLANLSVGTELPIPDLEGVNLSGVLVAPDGYAFRVGGRRSGLMTKMFGGRRHHDPVIYNGGAVVRLNVPSSKNLTYSQAALLGWIVN